MEYQLDVVPMVPHRHSDRVNELIINS